MKACNCFYENPQKKKKIIKKNDFQRNWNDVKLICRVVSRFFKNINPSVPVFIDKQFLMLNNCWCSYRKTINETCTKRDIPYKIISNLPTFDQSLKIYQYNQMI